MVDPRNEPQTGDDNGTRPQQPNVGGPAPDRPPAGPGDPRRRHRLLTGAVIVLAIAVIILGGLLAAPYFQVTEPADGSPTAAPPAATAQSGQAPAPKPGDCRTFEKSIEIGSETRTVTGRACMQPDGSWKVVE